MEYAENGEFRERESFCVVFLRGTLLKRTMFFLRIIITNWQTPKIQWKVTMLKPGVNLFKSDCGRSNEN